MNEIRTVSFVLWFEPFDIWRIRRTIRKMESESYQLGSVHAPCISRQRLSLVFEKVASVVHTEVKYVGTMRKHDFSSFDLVTTVVNDYLWIPLGHYYFLRKKCTNDT